MAHAKLFGEARSKTDIRFYDTARDIQAKNRLSDGCKASDFKKKADAWIHRIRPNLQQPYSDLDAAEFIVDMLPKKLATDGRRIKENLKKAGTFEQLPHLVEQLCLVISEEQADTRGASPALTLS